MPEVFECDQGTEEWFRCRMGIPTASEFATVLAQGRKKGEPSVTRKRYMRRLASEIVLGQPHETYSNHHFERGKELEPEARGLYAYAHGVDCRQVGFIKNGNAGCSPDSLIGEDGVLEIKTALPELVIELIEADRFPAQHNAQCQGALWITEREWIDLIVYWPGMPLFEKRAHRDEDFIARLAREVEIFNGELAELVARVRRYGEPSTLKDDLRASITHDKMMEQLQEAPPWQT